MIKLHPFHSKVFRLFSTVAQNACNEIVSAQFNVSTLVKTKKALHFHFISISISIFYFCSATIKTERNKQTYRTVAEEEKGRSNKTFNVIACTQ